MEAKERFDQLLANEKFQDCVLNLNNTSEEDLKVLLAKYSITENELAYAERLFSGLLFSKEKLHTKEINYEIKRLQTRIAHTSFFSKKEKVRKLNFLMQISKVAAILFIPLLLSTIYFYKESRTVNSEYFTTTSSKKVYNTFHAPVGAKTQVALPDGSLVWLNSGSTLSCPTAFDNKSRDVVLTGEAFFEVVKNEKIPMVVSIGNLKVKVYGTKFNVNAFKDDGLIKTTLVEGKVTIIPGESKNEYQLKPGYTASFAVNDQKIELSKVDDMDAITGWKEGKLLFHNESFAHIIKELERWYNVDIQLADTTLGSYTLYATFIDENVNQIFDILSNSIPIIVEYPKRVKNLDGVYSKKKIKIKRDPNRKIKTYAPN